MVAFTSSSENSICGISLRSETMRSESSACQRLAGRAQKRENSRQLAAKKHHKSAGVVSMVVTGSARFSLNTRRRKNRHDDSR